MNNSGFVVLKFVKTCDKSTYKEAVNTVVGRFTSLIFSKVSELKKETVCPWATVRMSWSLESSMPPTGLVKSIFLISWPLAMSQNLRVLSSPHEINLRSSVLNKACLIPAVWPERSTNISIRYQYQVPVHSAPANSKNFDKFVLL